MSGLCSAFQFRMVPSLLRLLSIVLIAAISLDAFPAHAKGKKGGGGKGQANKSEAGKGQKKGKSNKGKGKKGKGKQGKGKGQGGSGGSPSTGQVVRGDVLARILALNPGLNRNFLETEPPSKVIKLPNGKSTPIYKTKQFLDVNFRLTFFARKKEKGSDVVPMMEYRLRKIMATPQFHERVKEHRKTYKISPKGKVSAGEAYSHFRRINRNLGVTVGKQFKSPAGGGSGIVAPSWATFKAMNIFFHEACHCIGIGHDSGGLSGAIAGTMREWDRKKLWNYKTIDLNNLAATK